MTFTSRLALSLLLLRLGIAIVMLVWSVDKLARPEHAAGVFAAWPMLAACSALFLLRDQDSLASLGAPRRT